MKILYSICASFEGVDPKVWYPCDLYISHIKHAWPLETGLDVQEASNYTEAELEGFLEYPDLWEPGDDAEDLHELYASIKVSGLLSRSQLFSFLDDIGAFYDYCETLGTLGGPLGGLVPVFSFQMESKLVIESIRVTPVVCNDSGAPLDLPSESSWRRLKDLLKVYDCFDLATSGRALGGRVSK